MKPVTAAYRIWRRDSSALRSAYARWNLAGPDDWFSSYVAYRAALEREERAAKRYATLVRANRRARRSDSAGA
jgi:hypothetical protein